jgi:aminoglycoside phosphotransferase (APT) family kinase protein
MLREARFIAALHDTLVPVPEILATAGAGDVIDVPFYVMSVAEGPVVTTVTPAPLDSPTTRREIGESLIDTLTALHSVDWRAAGLQDVGKPEGFNARHLRSLSRLNADADGRSPAEFVAIERWLGDNVPEERKDLGARPHDCV